MKLILEESNSDIHIYYDDISKKAYYFDGTQLVEIDTSGGGGGGSGEGPSIPIPGEVTDGDSGTPGEPENVVHDNAPGNADKKDDKKDGDKPSPGKPASIGDRGDEEAQRTAREYHDAQLEKDKAEHPELYGDEETEEERNARIERIKNSFSDPEWEESAVGESEKAVSKDRAKIDKEIRDQKAADAKQVKEFSSPLRKFSESLRKFVKSQLKKNKESTWKIPNQRYEGTGIIRRGSISRERKSTPVINVYFDRSGSWEDRDLRLGEEAIGVLNNYVSAGKIKIKVFYFANHIWDTPSVGGEGGTHAGPELLEHIQATKPTNVIVMTDADFDRNQCLRDGNELRKDLKVSVPGAVWFLFRDGLRSEDLIKLLRGRKQTKIFDFNSVGL